LGDTPEQARERFAHSAFNLFRLSLQKTMMKGIDLDAYLAANLIGTPDEVCEKVAAFAQAGVSHFCATLFVGNTVDDLVEQMRSFARYVLPAFPESTQAVANVFSSHA
jgi:alkanesulfonate monooxygenase SsuD/methylene tetrahydromethanopterin reductase-like flavin-dependent oxidoreductase (luciferase family)